MSIQRAALAYVARGFAVFPLEVRGKVPAGRLAPRGFHDASRDPAQVRAWWRAAPAGEEWNVGVVPGTGRAVVLDLDGPVGAAAAVELGLLAEPTFSVTTGRPEGGRHVYFRAPPQPVVRASLARGIDVRHLRGYVVGAGSIHPSGRRYTAHGSLDAMLELPPTVAAILTTRPPRAAAPSRATPTTVMPSTPPATMDDHLERRIVAYIARLPVGMGPGQGRNPTAWRLAAWLVRDLALPEQDALPYLAAWNRRQAVPLDGATLPTVLHNAARYGAHPTGAAR